MCEEIELNRYDETPWGFRLTGGHDFGIPLTVVRVTGGSLAEESGMCVGDMIIEINGDSTSQITHSEAQQCILEAGNHITLSILRGSPVPAVTPTRGLYTPSAVDRATSSVESLTECESVGVYRDNVVSAVSESCESGHEMTEEEIAEKLLESAEVIENNGKNVIGVNFKRFVPKCDFIKNSLVFQTLQEEQIFDQKSEQDQLKRCPTKRFSTFMTTPNRPKIKPPEKKKPEEPKEVQVNKSAEDIKQNEENIEIKPCKQVCTNCKLIDIEDFVDSTDALTSEKCTTDVIEDNSENINKIKNEEEFEPKETDLPEEVENITIAEEPMENPEGVPGPEEIVEANLQLLQEPANEFEKTVRDIRDQIAAIRELPRRIQDHISLLEKQLSDLLSRRIESAEVAEAADDRGGDADAVSGEANGRREEGARAESPETFGASYDDDDDVFEADDGGGGAEEETAGEGARKTETDETDGVEEDGGRRADQETGCGRPMYPLTPLPRPIVLPGGRKWRGPKDAYNEKFIAETLISQAEVLVGSTLGVNFRKYEPPKFDLSNSAVYKLVHNIEGKNTRGIENRPEMVAAEEDFYYHKPIDARQYYLATLPQPSIVPDFENDNQYGY